jgi:hypothetical protein
VPHDLATATQAATRGVYDLTKATHTPRESSPFDSAQVRPRVAASGGLPVTAVTSHPGGKGTTVSKGKSKKATKKPKVAKKPSY